MTIASRLTAAVVPIDTADQLSAASDECRERFLELAGALVVLCRPLSVEKRIGKVEPKPAMTRAMRQRSAGDSRKDEEHRQSEGVVPSEMANATGHENRDEGFHGAIHVHMRRTQANRIGGSRSRASPDQAASLTTSSGNVAL